MNTNVIYPDEIYSHFRFFNIYISIIFPFLIISAGLFVLGFFIKNAEIFVENEKYEEIIDLTIQQNNKKIMSKKYIFNMDILTCLFLAIFTFITIFSNIIENQFLCRNIFEDRYNYSNNFYTVLYSSIIMINMLFLLFNSVNLFFCKKNKYYTNVLSIIICFFKKNSMMIFFGYFNIVLSEIIGSPSKENFIINNDKIMYYCYILFLAPMAVAAQILISLRYMSSVIYDDKIFNLVEKFIYLQSIFYYHNRGKSLINFIMTAIFLLALSMVASADLWKYISIFTSKIILILN